VVETPEAITIEEAKEGTKIEVDTMIEVMITTAALVVANVTADGATSSNTTEVVPTSMMRALLKAGEVKEHKWISTNLNTRRMSMVVDPWASPLTPVTSDPRQVLLLEVLLLLETSNPEERERKVKWCL